MQNREKIYHVHGCIYIFLLVANFTESSHISTIRAELSLHSKKKKKVGEKCRLRKGN